jgi:hypothetical protein
MEGPTAAQYCSDQSLSSRSGTGYNYSNYRLLWHDAITITATLALWTGTDRMLDAAPAGG